MAETDDTVDETKKKTFNYNKTNIKRLSPWGMYFFQFKLIGLLRPLPLQFRPRSRTFHPQRYAVWSTAAYTAASL